MAEMRVLQPGLSWARRCALLLSQIPSRYVPSWQRVPMNSWLHISAPCHRGMLSPLRYPGGKAVLAGFFGDIIEALGLKSGRYIEPYAGGAGAGITLLHKGVIEELVVNDIDPAVHAFWKSITRDNSNFIEMVASVPLTIDEWHKQREIYKISDETDSLRLGFAFFFLNRTNRSGILNAGVIGGQKQEGRYKIDARFNRKTLIERLTIIGSLANRITVTDLDGRTVIQHYAEDKKAFMYIDPPYVQAGSQLYLNAFDGRDHIALAAMVDSIYKAHWLMTYDTAPLIEKLYRKHFQCRLELTYSARYPGKAEELLIASPSVADAVKRFRSRLCRRSQQMSE